MQPNAKKTKESQMPKNTLCTTDGPSAIPGNKNLKLTLTQYIQSKEFKEQKTADKYVSFTAGLDF